MFYVNGCFLVEGVREGQSLQAGTTNKRTLVWLCRRLPSASCLPLGRHLGLLLFFPPSLGPSRTVPADLRVSGPCGGKCAAVATGGDWGWRRVKARGSEGT